MSNIKVLKKPINVIVRGSEIEDGDEIDEFKMRYEVLQNEKTGMYRLSVYLPFSFKSGWLKTKSQDWEKYALIRLNATIKSKYNAIKIRDFYNRKRFEKFKDLMGIKDDKTAFKLYSADLNHKELYEELGDYTIEAIWKELDDIAKTTPMKEIEKDTSYELLLKPKKFVKMLINSNCYYCGISVENILSLSRDSQLFTKRARGYSLEVDQKEAYEFYTDKNCVASCYWCNKAKADEFTVEEFRCIAKGMNTVWNQRLVKENVVFPATNYEKKEDCK